MTAPDRWDYCPHCGAGLPADRLDCPRCDRVLGATVVGTTTALADYRLAMALALIALFVPGVGALGILAALGTWHLHDRPALALRAGVTAAVCMALGYALAGAWLFNPFRLA